jgi:hypothetical protein
MHIPCICRSRADVRLCQLTDEGGTEVGRDSRPGELVGGDARREAGISHPTVQRAESTDEVPRMKMTNLS